MNLITEPAMIVNTEAYKVVKKSLKKGEKINKHNHPGYNVFFTPLTGNAVVTVEGEEINTELGTIINFDGENHISAVAISDFEVQVTLLKK